MKVARETLLWSFPAHALFGICNFLIGASNSLPIDNWAVIGYMWMGSGFIGLLVGLYFYRREGAFFFTEPLLGDDKFETFRPPIAITAKVKLVTIFGGLCVGISQLLMKQAFALAPRDAGPLTAVISSDVLIVSVFCHFVYRELLSAKQGSLVLAILVGLVLMELLPSGGAASEADVAGESTPGEQLAEFAAFGISVAGMVSFAAAVLAIRVGFAGGLAAWSGFVVRMLTLLAIGIIAFGYSVLTNGWPSAALIAWVGPTGAAVSQCGGVLCVNKALQYPNTGIANAIFASNSVTVLLLNAVFFGLVPGAGGLIGMLVVVGSVAGISLVEGSPDVEEDRKPVSPSQLHAMALTGSPSRQCS